MTRFRDHKGAARSNPGGPYAVFRAMVGREPDRGARARIEQVRSALQVRDDDAIWVVLAIFEAAIDRGERVYRWYVRVLVVAMIVMIAVSTTTLYVTDERLRSDGTAMQSAVAGAIHQPACGGIGDPGACEVARINAATPARRTVASAVSRLTDDQVTFLAGLSNLDQWLTWMINQAVTAVAKAATPQGAASARTPGK